MRAPTSMVGADQLEIRSFRVVFALERRLFRIDRWRLPVPYGIPVRGIAYAGAALVCALIAGAIPIVGGLARATPAPLRFVLIPVAIAAVLARVRIDGRPAHRCAAAWARHRLGPRTIDAFAPVPAPGSVHAVVEPVILAAGPETDDLRPGEVAGPATVILGRPAVARQRRHRLELTPIAGAPLRTRRQITLADGQRLVIRPAP